MKRKRKIQFKEYGLPNTNNKEYGFCCGTEPARKYKCPVSDCLFTNNRSGYEGERTKL